jgi:hypothetical protein
MVGASVAAHAEIHPGSAVEYPVPLCRPDLGRTQVDLSRLGSEFRIHPGRKKTIRQKAPENGLKNTLPDWK